MRFPYIALGLCLCAACPLWAAGPQPARSASGVSISSGAARAETAAPSVFRSSGSIICADSSAPVQISTDCPVAISTPVASSSTTFVGRIAAYPLHLAGSVRSQLSSRAFSASQRLDKMLGGKYHADVENNTGGDIRLEVQQVERGVGFSPNFNLHFDLPGAARRFNLIVEHVNRDVLGEGGTPESIQDQQSRYMNGQTEDSTVVGLRFFSVMGQKFRQHVDVGTTYSPFPNPFRVPKPFVRVNFTRLYEIGEWDGRWQALAVWRGQRKIEYFLSFDETRYLVPEKLSVTFDSSFHYESDNPSVDFVQSVSFPWTVTNRDSITPSVFASVTSYPAIVATGYSTGITYRRDLAGGKWLFFDATPTIDYSSSRAYHPFYRMTTAVQLYFGASRG